MLMLTPTLTHTHTHSHTVTTQHPVTRIYNQVSQRRQTKKPSLGGGKSWAGRVEWPPRCHQSSVSAVWCVLAVRGPLGWLDKGTLAGERVNTRQIEAAANTDNREIHCSCSLPCVLASFFFLLYKSDIQPFKIFKMQPNLSCQTQFTLVGDRGQSGEQIGGSNPGTANFHVVVSLALAMVSERFSCWRWLVTPSVWMGVHSRNMSSSDSVE